MPKETRKCKQCQTVFKKRYPLDMFCTIGCAGKYKKEKQDLKSNGPIHPKRKGSGTTQSRALQNDGPTHSEKELFHSIWGDDISKRKSFVTGLPLPDTHRAYPWYFSHVLPKGKNRYPMFKFYIRNVVLKTFEEHEQWEHHQYKLKDDPKWDHVFRLQEELKIEYDQHKADYEQGKVEYYKI